MKNYYFISIVLSLIISSCCKDDDFIGKECVNDFYYHASEKIYLDNLNGNYLIIGFDRETNDLTINTFINNFNYLDIVEIINDGHKYYCIVKFKTEKSCLEIETEISKLNNYELVLYANKAYNTDFFGYYGPYDLMFTTDQFNVKLKDNIEKSQLENLIAEIKNVSIIEENNNFPNVFLMSNTSKGRNTIQTSTLIYETGLFEYSEPNFSYIQFSENGIIEYNSSDIK